MDSHQETVYQGEKVTQYQKINKTFCRGKKFLILVLNTKILVLENIFLVLNNFFLDLQSFWSYLLKIPISYKPYN